MVDSTRVGGHHHVAPVGGEVDLRVEQLLLGVEHIEQRALADPLLLAHAGERDAVGIDAA